MILVAGAAGVFALACFGAPPLAIAAGSGATILLAVVEWLLMPRSKS